jgi:hypothetical protein
MESAVLEGYPHAGIANNHAAMVKYADKEDESYKDKIPSTILAFFSASNWRAIAPSSKGDCRTPTASACTTAAFKNVGSCSLQIDPRKLGRHP